MSLYAFKTDLNQRVLDWVKATKRRGQDNHLLKNPFVWKFKTIKRDENLIVVIDAKPVLFNYSWFGWITGIVILLLWGATLWVLPFLFIGCLGVFWSAEFMFLMTKKALRKCEYKGKVERLKYSALIREVLL